MPAPATRIIVVGSVNTDLVIRGSKLPAPGETVLGGRFFQTSGGKGANQAVAAARAATAPVLFLAAVGDDELGRAARMQLERENLIGDLIRVIPHVATGVALILVDEQGQNLISVASGANLHLAPTDVEQISTEQWRQSRVFLTSLEIPLLPVVQGLETARRNGLCTILNPAPAKRGQLTTDVLQLVDILTPNESEASELTEIAVGDERSAIEAARVLQSQGCGTVIITRGKDGCTVVERGRPGEPPRAWSQPALEANAVDTTAAGDAFNGALAVAIAEGRSLRDAVIWATRAAALCVSRQGAQPSLPTRAEIERNG